MTSKTTKIEVNGTNYFVKKMPALAAERLLLKSIGAITQGGLSAFPPEALTELLTYAGGYNANGGEVPFADEETVDMLGVPLEDIIEIQAKVIEVNFGFFAGGGINRLVERLTSIFVKAKPEPTKEATPES